MLASSSFVQLVMPPTILVGCFDRVVCVLLFALIVVLILDWVAVSWFVVVMVVGFLL